MEKIMIRLLKKVKEVNGCWNWKGSIVNGYGWIYFTPKKVGGKAHGLFMSTHRASWIIFNGVIPDGMMVCHKCDNRLCVNPDHLFIGTAKDNANDMVRKGRANPPIGERGGFSKLKERDVVNILKMLELGKLQKDIADKYNVSKITISDIKCCRTWKHIARAKDRLQG